MQIFKLAKIKIIKFPDIICVVQMRQVLVNSKTEVAMDLENDLANDIYDLGQLVTSLLRRCVSGTKEGLVNGNTARRESITV